MIAAPYIEAQNHVLQWANTTERALRRLCGTFGGVSRDQVMKCEPDESVVSSTGL